MIPRLHRKNFNDTLALLLLVVIPALWLVAARGLVDLAKLGDVNGALIMTWGLVVQYYFRRAPPNGTEGPPAPKPPGA